MNGPSTYLYRFLRTSWGIHITITADVLSHSDGGGLVAADISAAVAGRPVVVVIGSVVFNEMDYQLDGLTAAVMGWAAERFGLDRPLPAVSYDRSVNRYIFDWG